MATVLIPGSFDPVHLGHVDIIASAREIFGRVVVAVMHNPSKPSGLFAPEERVALVRASVEGLDGVEVHAHGGLAVQAAADLGADCIVKGLRTPADFDIEQQMAQNNFQLTGIRTVYLPCRPELGHISSRFIREIAAHGEDVSHLVTAAVDRALADTFSGGTARGEAP